MAEMRGEDWVAYVKETVVAGRTPEQTQARVTLLCQRALSTYASNEAELRSFLFKLFVALMAIWAPRFGVLGEFGATINALGQPAVETAEDCLRGIAAWLKVYGQTRPVMLP